MGSFVADWGQGRSERGGRFLWPALGQRSVDKEQDDLSYLFLRLSTYVKRPFFFLYFQMTRQSSNGAVCRPANVV